MAEHRLEAIYYDAAHPASFGGASRLIEAAGGRSQEQNARQWLSGQDAYTLHKPARLRFPRRPTIVAGVGEQLQADLMDVRSHARENDGVTFLLTAVDVFSRRAFVYPLKSKSAESVSRALRDMLEDESYRTIQTDKGKEFVNANVRRLLAERNMKWFSSENETIKSALVERFNRTLRGKIHRYLTWKRGERYIEALPSMVRSYNTSYHSSIGMAPRDVTYANQERVWHNLHGDGRLNADRARTKTPRFRDGQHVRISKARGAFERGYTPNWSVEIFVIDETLDSERPVVYRIKDLAGESVDGTFYEAELQRVKLPETFSVEEVLKWRGRGASREGFVKWLGYPASFNSWVREGDFA